MRIWVSRPEPGAARTAKRLEGLGHAVLVAPVLRIAPTGMPVPEGPFDGLILTSGNAVAATDGLPRDLSVFAVGTRTAERARRAGFSRVHCAEGHAGDLAALVAVTLQPGSRLLHAAGEDRKAEPAVSLAAAGFSVTIWSAYAARAAATLPEAAARALRAGTELGGALHFSRRSARVAAELCREAGLAGAFRALKHYCLSPDVEAGLAEFGVAAHFVAMRPSEDALLAGLPPPDRPAPPLGEEA
ncbi:uroporphyrinogen III synthase [Methylobacterium sp. Leaf456]|uniref:uroporphyrinogen-III synthase n=1 Tax=Methylobacterium sp. Leaf456 TaxID=1736382 RepID=UPI0006FF1FAF|nr:uroporphyrinogen-III synthase [Methylobacterium sp. Leaf456]KQT59776.1 uroporphyrinogen III synthase [Methylobacterium sp. Leaf456]